MILRFLFAASLAATSAAALAQTAPSQDDVVVRARRDAERKAIQTYVADISVRSESQLPRFHDPVCPLVVGLEDRYARIAEQRIREVAATVGAPVAKKEKCEVNLLVFLTDNGSDLVKDIRAHRSGWLGDLDPQDVRALIAPAPARAWSVTSLRNSAGGRQKGLIMRVMEASYIKQPTRQDMELSFVIIDKTPTLGMTLRQIADYAAMRGLARTRPPKAGGAIDTILNAFEPGATPPRELTATDAAYLRALYASDGLVSAVNERTAITSRIARGK